MGQFRYQVVRHKDGWAYRLESTYSRVFPTQLAATEAARAAAHQMHEPCDETLVIVQAGPLVWRLEHTIRDADGQAAA